MDVPEGSYPRLGYPHLPILSSGDANFARHMRQLTQGCLYEGHLLWLCERWGQIRCASSWPHYRLAFLAVINNHISGVAHGQKLFDQHFVRKLYTLINEEIVYLVVGGIPRQLIAPV